MNKDRSLFISSFKKIAKLLIFFALCICVIVTLEAVLKNRGSVVDRKELIFRQMPKDTEVIFIGNSHAYCTFIPAILEKRSDYKVYNAGIPDEKIDMTYYTLKKILKSHTPQIVVLESFAFGRTDQYYKGYIANIDSMDFSLSKMIACIEIFPNKKVAFEMFAKLYRCHNNWNNPKLVLKNIKSIFAVEESVISKNKGFYSLESKMSYETVEKYRSANDLKFTPTIDAYSVDYFNRIVELCQKRGIRLIITMAPFNDIYTEKIQYSNVYSKIRELCLCNDLEYIDYNMLYEELNLDYNCFEDGFSNAQHMNKWGAEIVSRHFAEYLVNSQNTQ